MLFSEMGAEALTAVMQVSISTQHFVILVLVSFMTGVLSAVILAVALFVSQVVLAVLKAVFARSTQMDDFDGWVVLITLAIHVIVGLTLFLDMGVWSENMGSLPLPKHWLVLTAYFVFSPVSLMLSVDEPNTKQELDS